MVESGVAAQPVAHKVEELPTARHAWVVLAVVFLLSMGTAGAWMVIPAIKDAFMGSYGGGSMSQFGSLMQFVSYGAFVGAIVAAPLGKKSIKAAFVTSGLFSTIGCVVVALSGTSMPLLLAGRVLLGVGVGLTAVTSVTALGIWFPLKTRGTAMAVWAVWVPVAMLLYQNAANPIISALSGIPSAQFAAGAGFMNPSNPDAASLEGVWESVSAGFHGLFWIAAVILGVFTVLAFVFYRAPREGEADATIRSKPPLREALPHLMKPKIIAVTLVWLVFNAVNQVNTSFIVVFMQSGYGFSTEIATLLGSIASAAGIAAIIFGFISDRIPVKNKYLLIVFSSACLVLAMVFGFKPLYNHLAPGAGLEGAAMLQFVAYMLCMFLGNAGLVACVRPYVPMLVGRGGVTAIGYALAGVTLIQYIGQMFNQPFGAMVDSLGGATGAFQSGQGITPEVLQATGAAFGSASWILVGIAVVGFIASFFLKIRPDKDR